MWVGTCIPTYRHGLVDTPNYWLTQEGNVSGNNDSVPQGDWMNLFPPTKPNTDTRNLRSVVFLSLEAYRNVGSVQIALNCVADLICCAACSAQCWQATWKYYSLGVNFHYLKKCLFNPWQIKLKNTQNEQNTHTKQTTVRSLHCSWWA